MVGGWPEPELQQGTIERGSWTGERRGAIPPVLKVFSYNMHFGVGREDDFEQRRTRAELDRVLEGIAELIRRLDPDVVLLQEVDFASDRTQRINQMRVLAEKAGFPYMAPVVTWDKGWLPFPKWPPSKHYGRMLSGQAVLSRWPIVLNERLHLPKPQSFPWWYRAFYLNRTLQHVRVNLAGRNLDVFNVHTEAYDVPNRQIHAEMVRDWVSRWQGKWNVLAGDFNAIPPEASVRKGFPDEPDCDMSRDRSVETVRKLGWAEIIPPTRYRSDEAAALTFPADRPNRRLDYLYVSPGFTIQSGRIVHEAETLSDHLPTFVEAGWPVP